MTQRALCRLAGFPSDNELAGWMAGGPARTTPLVVARLGAIARMINHEGPVFEEPR